MLRGPQTPGELKQRTERLHRFDNTGEVDAVLSTLAGRELVDRWPRRPGQKEDRYVQLLGGTTADAPTPVATQVETDRLAELEAAVSELRDEVAALRAELRRVTQSNP
jgi:uncharacterized protein